MTTVVVNTNPIVPLADVETFTVDASSAPIPVGYCVCQTTTGTVTLALAAALAVANGVLGVAITAGTPGGAVQVRENGYLSPTISGLASAGLVRVNPATGALQVVGSYLSTDYPIGGSTATGWVTMQRLLPSVGGGSSVIWGADLLGSTNTSQVVVALSSASPIPVTTALTFGANPASSGFLRAPNASTAVAFRNAANSGDINGVRISGANVVRIGDATATGAGLSLEATSAGGLVAFIGATATMSLANTSADFFKLGPPTATGSAYSSTGYFRFGDIHASAINLMAYRNSGNTADVPVLYTDGTGALYFGGFNGSTVAVTSNSTVSLSTAAGFFNAAIGGNLQTSYPVLTIYSQTDFAFDTTSSFTGAWSFKINGSLLFKHTTTKLVTNLGLNRKVNVQSANYAVTTSDDVVIFSATGKTATLPASPTVGDKYTIGLNAASTSNTYAISGNGKNIIFSGASNASITITTTATSYQAVTVIYDGTTWTAAPGF